MIRKLMIIVLTFMTAVSVVLLALSYDSPPKNMSYKRYYDSQHIGIAHTYSEWIILLNIGTDMKNIMFLFSFSQGTSRLTFRYRIEPQSSYKQKYKFAGFQFSRVIERSLLPYSTLKNYPLNEQKHILSLWPISRTSVKFPSWYPVVLFGFYPVLAFYRGPLRRWRRRRKGLCLKCGYNLTGNTTGICSECGTEIQ